MEVVLSAAAGDLVSSFFSFLMSKYPYVACSEEEKRVDRLQQLLLRAHMVVEEADQRYITNSDGGTSAILSNQAEETRCWVDFSKEKLIGDGCVSPSRAALVFMTLSISEAPIQSRFSLQSSQGAHQQLDFSESKRRQDTTTPTNKSCN